MNADEKLIGSLELLESQFRPLESRIAHETEPAIFYVLQPGDGE